MHFWSCKIPDLCCGFLAGLCGPRVTHNRQRCLASFRIAVKRDIKDIELRGETFALSEIGPNNKK